MKIRVNRSLRVVTAGACVAVLAACGGGGSSTSTSQGTLRVALTDAPSCGFDQVKVTVDRVRVHQSASASDTDSGWSEVVLNPPRKIDLLTLTNGVLYNLGQTALPAGQYQQVRLVLGSNSGSGTPANSVMPAGGAETALQTPSGMQSGIKLNAQFTVEAGQLADLVLDFDACKSIVQMGNGGYQMKPVIRVVPLMVSGGISGMLSTTISGTAVTQASVSAQKNGVVVGATAPDSSGSYTLSPVDARQSPFDLVITMSGAATSVVSGVPVTVGATTNVPAITMSASSAMSTVSGSVGPAAALPATVRALQAVGSVPAIEAASRNTDGAGAYSMTLPRSAAQLATYSPVALSFSASGTATTAGKYSIEATDVSGNVKTGTADVASGNATVNFTFP
ncbi:MAG: DUF4382 domain-containing protein [Gemmatimonadota bacterium]